MYRSEGRWLTLAQVKTLDSPQPAESYRRYQVEQIAADIKETIGRVSDGPFDAEQNANIPTVNYEVGTMMSNCKETLP
jgi:hypothetical protein